MLLEPEESRARPSAAGDQSGDLGQGAIALPPVENAILTDDYLMGGTLPFAQENGAGAGLTGRAGSPGCDRFTEEHAGGSKPAVRRTCAPASYRQPPGSSGAARSGAVALLRIWRPIARRGCHD